MSKEEKVLSRDEKRHEQWLEYFRNVKKEDDHIRDMLDFFKKFTEPDIKKLDPEWEDETFFEHSRLDLNYLDNHIEKVRKSYDSSKRSQFDKITEEFYNLKKDLADIENKSEKSKPKNNNYLTSLYLKNFKGFSEDNAEEDNTINIKPITLIYGPNSFGKSSILQTLLLLNQTSKERDYKNTDLYLGGTDDLVNLGTYQNFINNHDTNKELTIKLTLPYKQLKDHHNSMILTQISLSYNFKLEDDKIKLISIDVFKYRLDYSDIDNPVKKELKPVHYDIENPVEKKSFFSVKNAEDDKENDIAGELFDGIDEIIENIVYVSSYRKVPERVFISKKRNIDYVGKYGENTAEILNNDDKTLQKVNEWLYKIAKYNLSKKEKNRDTDSVSLDDKATNVQNINLLDLGSGIAQVLPIITQTFKAKNKMVLIEEPEIHLHPRAQAEIGEMFADAIKEPYNNTFIIETHSENLLLRLQRLIKNGELSKDDVSVIYVDKDEKGSYCIPLEMDDKGYIINIMEVPDGFFEEGFNELFNVNRE